MNQADSRICWNYVIITNSDLTNQKIEFPFEIAEKFIGKISPFLATRDKLTLKTEASASKDKKKVIDPKNKSRDATELT